ncbi:MAG: ATP-binding cassette domain-containing protein, partial [Pseudomonadota bacterium]
GSASTAHIDSPFEFRFPTLPRGRDPLVELREARIGHSDGSPLITSCDLALRSGERFALLGRNGAGKTTLLRSLCGDLPLLDGERHSSEGCRIAYFDQQQVDTLDLEASALLHLQRLSPEAREQELRDFLGGFDFRGDRAEAPLAPFSGGEKARLALALLAWQRPNVLILDEPTNHLDLEMRRALELALLDFAGALVLVSHDRHLLRSTADRLLLLADGRLAEFEGDISAYEAHILGAPAESRDKPDAPEQRNEADRRDQRRAAAAARAQRRPLQREIEQLECAIEEQQSALAQLETALAEPELYGPEAKTRLQGLLQEQGERRQRLSKLEEDWLSRQEALEALSD